MPRCVFCGAETPLHVKGAPICVECDGDLARQKRVHEAPPTKPPSPVQDPKQPPPDKRNAMTDELVRVLFVSPVEADHDFMRGFFARTNWNLYSANTFQDAEEILASEPIAIVILDREFSGRSWQDLLNATRGCSTSPVVLVTWRFSELDMIDQLLEQGAYDVIAKPFEDKEISQIISFAWLRWRSKRRSLLPLAFKRQTA